MELGSGDMIREKGARKKREKETGAVQCPSPWKKKKKGGGRKPSGKRLKEAIEEKTLRINNTTGKGGKGEVGVLLRHEEKIFPGGKKKRFGRG